MPAARQFVKFAFRQVFRHGKSYVIRMGPLKGLRWHVHRDHQFWMPLGLYEAETAGWLAKHLKPGMCFFDVGANAGYFTLLGSRAVGPTGTVRAFEPVPANVEVIRQQVRLNELGNAEVCALALSDRCGRVEFVLEENNANSHISEIAISHAQSAPRESFEVETKTMDAWVAESGLKPDLVKIDVEGAEVQVLAGAADTLANVRPLLLVSTHSNELCVDVKKTLDRAGYRVEPLQGFDHELVAYPG